MLCAKCNLLEAVPPALWCPGCIHEFRTMRAEVHQKQNPAPGCHAVWKFTTAEPPRSVDGQCPLCGSFDLESGYGFAGGYGLGVYNCCNRCFTVLDFSEDSGE